MLEELKEYAKENNVPIMFDEGIDFLLYVIRKENVKTVLEIGSAIGYSALAMSSLGVDVDTMERNEEMILKAKENLLKYDKEHHVRLIEADALLYNGELKSSYDLIFIDAAKAQYIKFFDKYSPYLSANGVIVSDNLLFHRLDKTKVNRNTRQLIGKIEKYVEFLKNNEAFDTTFYELGDGVSISRRKQK